MLSSIQYDCYHRITFLITPFQRRGTTHHHLYLSSLAVAIMNVGCMLYNNFKITREVPEQELKLGR